MPTSAPPRFRVHAPGHSCRDTRGPIWTPSSAEACCGVMMNANDRPVVPDGRWETLNAAPPCKNMPHLLLLRLVSGLRVGRFGGQGLCILRAAAGLPFRHLLAPRAHLREFATVYTTSACTPARDMQRHRRMQPYHVLRKSWVGARRFRGLGRRRLGHDLPAPCAATCGRPATHCPGSCLLTPSPRSVPRASWLTPLWLCCGESTHTFDARKDWRGNARS